MPSPPEHMRETGTQWPVSWMGRTRCHAVNKSTGHRCKAYTCANSNYCRYHGGRHVDFHLLHALRKMGRYDDIIKNEALRDKYKRTSADKAITDQKDDLALLRAMCEVIVERAFPEGASVENMALDRVSVVTNLLKQVDQLISAITEREKKLDMLVRVDSVKELVDRIVDTVSRHVDDPEVLRKIASEITSSSVTSSAPPTLQAQLDEIRPEVENTFDDSTFEES